MKMRYMILTVCVLLFSACFEDEGNYKYTDVEGIEISGIKPVYPILSFVDKLEIPIEVNTSYTDLTYEWYVYDPKVEEKYNPDETYEAELIGTDKNLSYEVGWEPGFYIVMVKVTSQSNNYAVYAKTNVEVTTELSRGFYILKETADGNTELDLHYDDSKPVAANLIAKATGESMRGKPLCLGVVYGHGYIDPETSKAKTYKTLCVSTEKGELSYFKTDDFARLYDKSSIRYGGMAEDEMPIASFTFGVSNFLVSNKGISGAYASTSDMPSGGVFATTSGTGASRFFVEDGSMALIYWNEAEQRIDYADQYTFGHGFFGEYDENGYSTQGMECIACGSSHAGAAGAINFFLLKDASGKKYLYYVDSSASVCTARKVEIPSDSKLANATLYATNVKTATFMYYVYNNQLYVYNLGNDTEEETSKPLQGISSDETITYLSYQYMDSDGADTYYDFNHLMVGTQKGNTYRIYMYDISGGYPTNLVRTIKGEGKLVMSNYASPKFDVNGMASTSIPNR